MLNLLEDKILSRVLLHLDLFAIQDLKCMCRKFSSLIPLVEERIQEGAICHAELKQLQRRLQTVRIFSFSCATICGFC